MRFIDASELHRSEKITEVEVPTKVPYNNRIHQSDNTGVVQERKSLYTRIFFKYFYFVVTYKTPTNTARNTKQRNTCVNRSLIDQHAALLSEDTQTTRNIIALADQESGTEDMGDEAVVSEMNLSFILKPRRRLMMDIHLILVN